MARTLQAFKLLRVRKDGTLSPLFINKRQVLPRGVWLKAGAYPTKGFAFRPGWHVAPTPHAPHLGLKGRVWMRVEIKQWSELKRPASQGGTWYLAKWMKVLDVAKTRL